MKSGLFPTFSHPSFHYLVTTLSFIPFFIHHLPRALIFSLSLCDIIQTDPLSLALPPFVGRLVVGLHSAILVELTSLRAHTAITSPVTMATHTHTVECGCAYSNKDGNDSSQSRPSRVCESQMLFCACMSKNLQRAHARAPTILAACASPSTLQRVSVL